MEMTLIEKTGQTRIKCSIKAYPRYAAVIDGYITLHGGRKERETSRYVYYIVDADLMNKGR
jgi:hypothetical protein